MNTSPDSEQLVEALCGGFLTTGAETVTCTLKGEGQAKPGVPLDLSLAGARRVGDLLYLEGLLMSLSPRRASARPSRRA